MIGDLGVPDHRVIDRLVVRLTGGHRPGAARRRRRSGLRLEAYARRGQPAVHTPFLGGGILAAFVVLTLDRAHQRRGAVGRERAEAGQTIDEVPEGADQPGSVRTGGRGAEDTSGGGHPVAGGKIDIPIRLAAGHPFEYRRDERQVSRGVQFRTAGLVVEHDDHGLRPDRGGQRHERLPAALRRLHRLAVDQRAPEGRAFLQANREELPVGVEDLVGRPRANASVPGHERKQVRPTHEGGEDLHVLVAHRLEREFDRMRGVLVGREQTAGGPIADRPDQRIHLLEPDFAQALGLDADLHVVPRLHRQVARLVLHVEHLDRREGEALFADLPIEGEPDEHLALHQGGKSHDVQIAAVLLFPDHRLDIHGRGDVQPVEILAGDDEPELTNPGPLDRVMKSAAVGDDPLTGGGEGHQADRDLRRSPGHAQVAGHVGHAPAVAESGIGQAETLHGFRFEPGEIGVADLELLIGEHGEAATDLDSRSRRGHRQRQHRGLPGFVAPGLLGAEELHHDPDRLARSHAGGEVHGERAVQRALPARRHRGIHPDARQLVLRGKAGSDGEDPSALRPVGQVGLDLAHRAPERDNRGDVGPELLLRQFGPHRHRPVLRPVAVEGLGAAEEDLLLVGLVLISAGVGLTGLLLRGRLRPTRVTLPRSDHRLAHGGRGRDHAAADPGVERHADEAALVRGLGDVHLREDHVPGSFEGTLHLEHHRNPPGDRLAESEADPAVLGRAPAHEIGGADLGHLHPLGHRQRKFVDRAPRHEDLERRDRRQESRADAMDGLAARVHERRAGALLAVREERQTEREAGGDPRGQEVPFLAPDAGEAADMGIHAEGDRQFDLEPGAGGETAGEAAHLLAPNDSPGERDLDLVVALPLQEQVAADGTGREQGRLAVGHG